MSLDKLQDQVIQFYNGVSEVAVEQTKEMKKQYPLLSQVDLRVSAAVLGLISFCIAPLYSLTGICVGFFGMGHYPHILKNVQYVANAPVELKIIAVAVAAILFYTYAGILLPMGVGLTAGALLAFANNQLIKKDANESPAAGTEQKAPEISVDKAAEPDENDLEEAIPQEFGAEAEAVAKAREGLPPVVNPKVEVISFNQGAIIQQKQSNVDGYQEFNLVLKLPVQSNESVPQIIQVPQPAENDVDPGPQESRLGRMYDSLGWLYENYNPFS